MVVVRFKSHEEHEHILEKVGKMKRFINDLEECLEDCFEEDDVDYRSPRYRREYDEDDMRHESRYGYRRGGRRM